MMIPNPSVIARLLRGPVEVVPDPVEPDPPLGRPVKATPVLPKCHCGIPYVGHGVRYGWQLGYHEWTTAAGPSPQQRREAAARAEARGSS